MTKPVTVFKPKHIGGQTLFILRVNDGRRRAYNGIIIKGKHSNYSAVNDISLHIKELYQFTTAEKLTSVARDIIALHKAGATRVKYAGAVFGDKL
jgi:hypothetical protein